MLVVTNRNIVNSHFNAKGIGDDECFGERPNVKGANEIRVSNAVKLNNKWQVELAEEPKKLTASNLPSFIAFGDMLSACQKSNRQVLFFVHGFNKSFKESLDQARRIEERNSNVEVVLFSWPSNTGGWIRKEYRNVKRVAMASTGALDSIFEKLATYLARPFDGQALLDCEINLNLMTYSMGNLLLQNYINSAAYGSETKIFTNIILCQADVDHPGHEQWIENMQAGQRIYITINENDKILGWSDANGQPDRLGRTSRQLVAENSIYMDFTNGHNIGNKHQLWGKDAALKKAFTILLSR